MQRDELLVFFKDLRNSVEKKGDDYIYGLTLTGGGHGSVVLGAGGIKVIFHNPDGARTETFWPDPPDKISRFLGDSEGGSGWIVEKPDGSKSTIYVDIPQDVINISLDFSNPPKTHLGQPIENRSARSLCALYVAYLRQMVKDAEESFGSTD